MTPIGSVKGKSELGGHPLTKVHTVLSQLDSSQLTAEQVVDVAAAVTADVLTGKAIGSVASYLARIDALGKVERAAEVIGEAVDSISGAQKAATAEGIVFDVVSQAKAAEAVTTVESAVEAGKIAEQATKGMLGAGDTFKVLKQEGQNVKSGSGDASASKYNKSGTYQDALKDFESMDLSEVKDISTGKLGKLPDGKVVTARTRSSDGSPTLEIFDPIKKQSIKFRYGD